MKVPKKIGEALLCELQFSIIILWDVLISTVQEGD